MEINFYNIRSIAKGQADGFEELCCQLFFREFNDTNKYDRFRGDGGDGGVEAVFTFDDSSKIAIQAKNDSNLSILTDHVKVPEKLLMCYFQQFNLVGSENKQKVSGVPKVLYIIQGTW